MTPIDETLQFISNKQKIIAVVTGGLDKVFDTNILSKHCKKEGIKLDIIKDAGHSLEALDDVGVNTNACRLWVG